MKISWHFGFNTCLIREAVPSNVHFSHLQLLSIWLPFRKLLAVKKKKFYALSKAQVLWLPWTNIVYNYPPKGRWIVVDIYRDAKHRGIYPPLFTDPEGSSCFSIYQIRWIKNASSISSSKTFAKRRAIFLSVRKTVNIQGYSKLWEPIKTFKNCYPLIW